MSVVNIERSQGLSALRLISAVDGLAGASLLAQVRAMVVERQPGAAPFSTDTTARALLSVRQSQLRGRAAELLNELQPSALTSITDLQHFVLLMLEIQKEAHGSDEAVEAILGALTEQARGFEQRSASLAARATAAATQAAEEQAELDKLIDAEVRRIDGTGDGGKQDGELAQVRAQIAMTSEAMSAAVQATVDSSRKVGSGIGRIVTWVASLFSVQTGDTPRKPAKDDDGEADGDDGTEMVKDGKASEKAGDKAGGRAAGKDGGKAKPDKPSRPRITPERPTEDFPVETIGEIGDDTAAVFDARTKLNSLVIQQRNLYVQLYRAEADLAVMQVVGQQGSDLVAALQGLGSRAEAVRAEWERLAAECEQARGSRLSIDDSWARQPARIDALLRSFASRPASMPRLTHNVSPIA